MQIADDSWASLQGAMSAANCSTTVPPVEDATAAEMVDPQIDTSADELYASVGGIDNSEV